MVNDYLLIRLAKHLECCLMDVQLQEDGFSLVKSGAGILSEKALRTLPYQNNKILNFLRTVTLISSIFQTLCFQCMNSSVDD